MPCTHRTHRGPDGLELRKERGTTACLEKAQRNEIAVEPAGQRKTCMAKATLPEPQSPGIYMLDGVAAAAVATHRERVRHISRLTPEVAELCSDPAPSSPPGPSAIQRGKGTNGAPNHVASRYARNHGTACSRMGPSPGPVWRRSSHSTQTPGATPRTAGGLAPDGRAHKGRATGPKAPPTGGRGTASTRTQHTMG